ncbi:leucine-rich repeat neuronal protein 1-like [Schistocerca americana]|nr:leucine-rich repeat neuronal protein 1-like [Schistocerca americana]
MPQLPPLRRPHGRIADFKGCPPRPPAQILIRGSGRTSAICLRSMDLSHNTLRSFFLDLPALRFLNLSSNGIRVISPTSFLLPEVIDIDLSYNQIAVLDQHTFKDSPKLQVLRMAGNQLSRYDNLLLPLVMRMLDLSYNKIVTMEETSLDGLNISRLMLGHNGFRSLPQAALSRVGYVGYLNMDGTQITTLRPRSLNRVRVGSISLSRSSTLAEIDSHALTRLPFLRHVRISENPSLVYISPSAVSKSPNVTYVDYSKNNLLAVEEEMRNVLPNLTEIHVAGNNLVCHCGMAWLHTVSPEPVLCREENGTEQAMPEAAEECPPVIMPTFPSTILKQLSHNLTLRCRAVASPPAKISWRLGSKLPVGRPLLRVRECVRGGRACVDEDSTLNMRYLHIDDSGTYYCIAENAAGSTRRPMHLAVSDVLVRLYPIAVTSNFVTLSWNMTGGGTGHYLLRYNNQVIRFQVGVRIHSYTVHGLKPGTHYHFSLCIERDGYVFEIGSTELTTREDGFMRTLGINRNYSTAISLSVMAGALAATCASACLLRIYRQRSQLRCPPPTNLASVSFIDMPVECSMASPPSTESSFITNYP